LGEVFARRYELVDVLGHGGMGWVWRAWDHHEGRYVAAKVLRQSDASSLMRFVREQSFRVHHPHVVTPLGWVGEDDRVLFTMPVVRGGSVSTLLGDRGALPAPWAAVLVDQLLDALSAVHGAGLVHRDIKPGNLLLGPTGAGRPHLRLSDFGVATPVGEPRLTRASVLLGTPGYLAPEQLRGDDPDPVQDLYAVGVVARELLTGRSPSDPSAAAAPGPAVPGAPEHAVPVAPGPAVPEALWRLVQRLVAPDPAGRPEGADHARRQLAATGWLPAPGTSPPPGEAAGVEVFDQVPALPDGWGSGGPESRLARPRTDRGPTPRRTRPRQPTGPGPPALPAVTASADLPPPCRHRPPRRDGLPAHRCACSAWPASSPGWCCSCWRRRWCGERRRWLRSAKPSCRYASYSSGNETATRAAYGDRQPARRRGDAKRCVLHRRSAG